MFRPSGIFDPSHTEALLSSLPPVAPPEVDQPAPEAAPVARPQVAPPGGFQGPQITEEGMLDEKCRAKGGWLDTKLYRDTQGRIARCVENPEGARQGGGARRRGGGGGGAYGGFSQQDYGIAMRHVDAERREMEQYLEYLRIKAAAGAQTDAARVGLEQEQANTIAKIHSARMAVADLQNQIGAERGRSAAQFAGSEAMAGTGWTLGRGLVAGGMQPPAAEEFLRTRPVGGLLGQGA